MRQERFKMEREGLVEEGQEVAISERSAVTKKLKALRLENKMTQEYVASRLNVARSTIAGYETKNRQPSHEKLASIASLFHVTIDYLLQMLPPHSLRLKRELSALCRSRLR